MVTHMTTKTAVRELERAEAERAGDTVKTTINLPRGLLDEARRTAHEEQTTLRSLFESGLRRELQARAKTPRPFKLEDGSFRGEGVQPGIDLRDWDQIRSLIYEGRGG